MLSETDGMNGTFALVLGLVGLIYIAAVMGVIGMEVNVVLARHLYPRSLLTLFLDKVDLTPADKRAYTYYVRSQRHKVNEIIDVRFDEDDEEPPPPDPDELRRQPPTTTLEALDGRGPSADAPPAPPPSRD